MGERGVQQSTKATWLPFCRSFRSSWAQLSASRRDGGDDDLWSLVSMLLLSQRPVTAFVSDDVGEKGAAHQT